MSYFPLPSSQPNKVQLLKHRNPIFKQLKYPRPQPIHTLSLESQITSSLLLQQLLYYNVYYSAIFFVLYLASQVQRFLCFEYQYGVPIRIIIFAVWTLLQLWRLPNGFHGNLKESFPEVFAFLMLTFFTIATQIALLAEIVPCSPLQWTLLFYGTIIHCMELLVSIFTMGRLTKTQKAIFLWRNPISYSKK